MCLLNESIPPDQLTRFIVSHINDGHFLSINLLILIKTKVDADNLTTEVLCPTYSNPVLHLCNRGMGMPNDKHINLRAKLKDSKASITASVNIILRIQSHMSNNYQDIDLVIQDIHYPSCSRTYRGIDKGIGLFTIPSWCIWIGKADDTDLYSRPLYYGVRQGGHGAINSGHICGKHWEICQFLHTFDQVLSKIELMVSQCKTVIIQEIHRTDDRMLAFSLVIQIISHDIPLDNITIIYQDDSWMFLTHLRHIGSNAGHTVVVCLLVVLITESPDISMNICGGKNDQFLRLFWQGLCKEESHCDAKHQNAE